MTIPRFSIEFFAMSMRDSVVAYLFSASSASAVLSSHAFVARSAASVRISLEEASESTALDILTSLMSMSLRIATALLPLRSVSLSPFVKAESALSASLLNSSLNASCERFATLAKSSSPAPVSTASCKDLSILDIAEPPASASIPSDESAVAAAIIWGSERPVSSPVEASRKPMLTISASVVAKLLPRSTTVDPSRSKLP
ncbi:unknown [Eubacterium sp. CAG:786]|nr:unknown [Eubacterium sp. CAG:786]